MSYYNQELLIDLENKKTALLTALEDILSCVDLDDISGGWVTAEVHESYLLQALEAIKLAKN